MRCQRRVLKTWQPTLRIRLALWAMGLLFLTALGLTLFINVATTVVTSPPNATGVPLVEIPVGRAATAAPDLPVEDQPDVGELSAGTSSDVLRSVRIISLIGVGLVAILGGAGAYWLAGRALRPLREISRAAQGIGAGSLDARLASDGPDDELKELANAFNTMLARLERAFSQQRRFVSDAAHELRTPLSTLRVNLEAALSCPADTAHHRRDMAEASERSLTRLERLITDLLILATEDRALAGEEIALGPVLEDVLLDLRPVADERDVSLHFVGEAEVAVRGEEALLRRAFYNLIENAIHYNRSGGKVEVAMHVEGASAIVTVTDTGIGIAAEDQLHIFDRFYRAHPPRGRHRGGVGLGLAIVADIVRRHSGTIVVKSVPGVGSTFTVRLPV